MGVIVYGGMAQDIKGCLRPKIERKCRLKNGEKRMNYSISV